MEEGEDCFHEAKFIDQNGLPQTIRVPVVQELARQGLKHLPERFISVPPPPPDHPSAATFVHGVSVALPAIDMAKLRDGFGVEGRAQELDKLASGAKEWGMFLIRNHGIPYSVLRDVKDVVKGFFGLTFEEKKGCVGSYMSVDNMGYGRNFVKSEDQPLDWIDRLTMKAAPKEETDQGLLVWPQRPANFREAIEKYVEEARKVCDELLQALAEALSLERHVFLQNFKPEKSEMKVRVNYYPPCPRPDLALGITPHSDVSALTLLMQFEATGGLQVLKSKKWMAVSWPLDSLLVNLGDFMEIMSNGRLKSPWHRVVTQVDAERFSVALFYNPPPHAEIEPVLDEKPIDESYKKVVVGEYLEHAYEISPTATKQAIMFAKVH